MFASGKSKASASTDSYFNYVPLLLPGDGTNGAQNNTFVDGSTNNFSLTRNGNATQGSFSPYGSLWSNYWDGSSYFSFTGITFNGDFCAECWYYRTTNPTNYAVIFGGSSVSGANNFQFCVTNSGGLYLVLSATAVIDNDAGTSVTANQWNHIAWVRSGTNCAIFVNGVRQATGTSSDNSSICSRIGDIAGLSGYRPIGYISNARIVVGSSVYDPTKTTITVPTTNLTAITNTKLLTCQSNNFIDNSSSALSLIPTGSPTVSKLAPFNPTSSYTTSVLGGSGYFDGSGDYLNTPNDTSTFPASTDTATFEAWIYLTVLGVSNCIMAKVSVNSIQFQLRVDTNNKLDFGSQTGGGITGATSLAANTWYHVAAVCGGGNAKLYVNGVEDASGSVTLDSYTNPFYMGCLATSGPYAWFFNGYICDARVLKGTALYTTTFTPPTSPLTAITNTQFLCNFTNAGIYDNAIINDSETVGNAQISTSVKKFGTGSMAFDGTGDYLTFIDRPELQLCSGNFTVEGWVYLSATGVAYGIVSKGTSTTGWSVNVTSGNKLQFSYTSSNLTGATSLSATTWYHFAVVRNGSSSGNLVIYLNGTSDATSAGAVTDNFNQTSILYVGADRVAGSNLNGNIDDLRITNGVARYTANFTPPTSAFPTY